MTEATKHRVLSIAVGDSRKTKIWKNKTVTWDELCNRLSKPAEGGETAAEFKALPKSRQSELKDVGGFVGGYCNNGRRTDVRFRSVVTLDADSADMALWPDFQRLFGNAACVYSTRSHTPEKPRLRLVIPLMRDVTVEEYQAISRRVADTLGLQQFDPTTHEPGRLMFWPSVCQGARFIFKQQDGTMLDPDAILHTYTDWHDVTSWPGLHERENVVRRQLKRQADPLTKPGMIGAFCRAYPIHDAIAAFVPDYEPCADADRYTYTPGSTAAGVVVYDSKFSYSHHATDPASGVLCNAWDLVRLHKFHDLDADAKPDTPPEKLPSFKAMEDFSAEDPTVKIQLVNDRTAQAAEDFSEPLSEVGEASDPDTWKTKLKVTKNGAIASTGENALIILRNDPALKGAVALDEFAHRYTVVKPLPWGSEQTPRAWTDADEAQLRLYFESRYGITCRDKINDAVSAVTSSHAFHPVWDYLNSLSWDGVPRVDTLLVDYLGAEDTMYTRAVTRKFLAAAVARVFDPGCKFDCVLTVRGKQGIGKSSLFAKLGGAWFSDTFLGVSGKESCEQLAGRWMIEIAELAGMRKAEVEPIKRFISATADYYRPAYGRNAREYPRQCVFVATTNEAQFLRDPSGNRRFWVVDTPNAARKSVWNDLTEDERNQIWAEAVAIYHAHEPLFLPGELAEAAEQAQERHRVEDPRVGLVLEYLDKRIPANDNNENELIRRNWSDPDENGEIRRTRVCAAEIWVGALGKSRDTCDNRSGREISAIMAQLPEWQYTGEKIASFGGYYGRQRYYYRVE